MLSAREAFIYLLLFFTLYLVAFSLGSLLFQYINLAFPDPASHAPMSARRSIIWSISTLIVTTPVFLYMSRITSRELEMDSSKRASPIRLWLTYLTLFVAACVVIGDLIRLVGLFLGGELTVRIVLKVLTVRVIAGTVFWYYLSGLRPEEVEVETRGGSRLLKWLAGC